MTKETFYKNRDGSLVPVPISNNRLIEKMFSHTVTRGIMKLVSARWFAEIERAVLSSFFSSFFITKFVRKNGIKLREYKKKKYTSFHDFFYREIKPESRPLALGADALISPCDCKASVYRIHEDSCFAVKGVPYTVAEVLGGDEKLAAGYNGGYFFLLRLSLDDYHHYCYPVSGRKEPDVAIPGKLYTVHPLIHKYAAVYRENARRFSVITTENAHGVLMMEVGALGVGKVVNDHTGTADVAQGQEAGHFEFGGSTILVLVPEGSYIPDEDLTANTKDGFETVVKLGQHIGQRI